MRTSVVHRVLERLELLGEPRAQLDRLREGDGIGAGPAEQRRLDAGQLDQQNFHRRLRADFDAELAAAIGAGNVQPVRDRYLGRKNGFVTQLMAGIAGSAPEERKTRGAITNQFKQYIEQQNRPV